MDHPHTDPVNLLCDLAEASGDDFHTGELHEWFASAASILFAVGALKRGAPLRAVTCRACDDDHPAAVEFEPETGRHYHFCPKVGFVTVDDADLATLYYDPEWLVDWLVSALPIAPPVRRRDLVTGRVWHLGDAQCGETLLTVVLARKVSTQIDLDNLAAVLGTLPPADLGVVVTSSPFVARRVDLPHGYRFLDLREFVRPTDTHLVLDRAKIGAWIRLIQNGSAKSVQTRPGRSTDKAHIMQLYKERRSQGQPFVNISAEARKIRAELIERLMDRDPPHLATIRKHITSIRG